MHCMTDQGLRSLCQRHFAQSFFVEMALRKLLPVVARDGASWIRIVNQQSMEDTVGTGQQQGGKDMQASMPLDS